MPTGINPSVIIQYSSGVIGVINGILVPVLIAIAFIVFLWGIYKYFILGATNEGEKGEGRQFALWGIVGFVIILSLWGLVNLVMGTLGLSVGTAPPYPTIGGSTPVGGQNAFVGGAPIGSSVYNPVTGTSLGRVDSSGNIINGSGNIIGRMQNGQAVDNYGSPINGATVGTTASNSICAGRAAGSSCVQQSSGRSGTCDYNESNVFDCYATPGGNTTNGNAASATCPNGVNADGDCITVWVDHSGGACSPPSTVCSPGLDCVNGFCEVVTAPTTCYDDTGEPYPCPQ